MPIDPNWTTPSELNGAEEGLPAHQLAEALGALPLAELIGWRIEVAAVVADLAAQAGLAWPFDRDDPLIALLRALGRLAVQAPDVTSTLGAPLLEALARR